MLKSYLQYSIAGVAAASLSLIASTPAKATCFGAGSYNYNQITSNNFCVQVEDKLYSDFTFSSTDFWKQATYEFAAIETSGDFDIYLNEAGSGTGYTTASATPIDYYGYNLAITDPLYQFDTVTIDTTGSAAFGDYGAAKLISWTGGFTGDFAADEAKALTEGIAIQSIDGSPSTTAFADSVQQVAVFDYIQVEEGGVLSTLTNSFTQTRVPGPLPIFGALGGLAYARKIRRRLKAN